MVDPFKPELNYTEGLAKAQSFCALQDRAEAQVVKKFRDWKVEEASQQPIIDRLYEQKFLDQTRFAHSYVRGKFNQKKWGRHKIRVGLQQLQIPKYLIEEAMVEIDPELYLQTANKLMLKKRKTFTEFDWDAKQKTARFLASKGYESDLIMDLVNGE